MGMAVILIMWPRCGKQTFVPWVDGGSIWNLASIGPVGSAEMTFEECGFIPYMSLYKSSVPWVGDFLCMGYNLNNLDKGSQNEVTN